MYIRLYKLFLVEGSKTGQYGKKCVLDVCVAYYTLGEDRIADDVEVFRHKLTASSTFVKVAMVVAAGHGDHNGTV